MLRGGLLGTWLFESREFKEWLSQRSPYEDEARGDRTACTSCGTPLAEVGFSLGAVCGFCLAYEYGVDSQERMMAAAACDLVASLAEGSLDTVQPVLRRLVAALASDSPGSD